MTVNLDFEKRSNLYSVVKRGAIDYPCIYTGIDSNFVTKQTHQMGWSYKIADYNCNFAYAENKIQHWSQVGIANVPDRLCKIIYIASIHDIDLLSDEPIWILLDSNVHIHCFDYNDSQDSQYKDTDVFMGCGLQLTTIERGESIVVAQSDVWADRLLIHYGRFGLVSKVVPFDYNNVTTDYQSVVPWHISI